MHTRSYWLKSAWFRCETYVLTILLDDIRCLRVNSTALLVPTCQPWITKQQNSDIKTLLPVYVSELFNIYVSDNLYLDCEVRINHIREPSELPWKGHCCFFCYTVYNLLDIATAHVILHIWHERKTHRTSKDH